MRIARLSLAILLIIPLIAAPAQPVDEYQARVCRILFVGSPQSKRDAAVLATIEPGVLTVGESNNATSEGTVINFTLEGANVRFKINTDAADRQKLRLSSKLLSLANASKK